MKKFNLIPVILLILFIFASLGCDTGAGSDPVILSSEKAITAFSFTAAANTVLDADVTGTINGTSITATVPYGTDVSALVATFTSTGESVTVGNTAQTSGTTANDFHSDVTYTVTAEDGSTQDYSVSLFVAANSANEMTSFSFTQAANSSTLIADITGTFEDDNIIRVNVPAGTVLTDLIAEFSLSDDAHLSLDNVAQVSGTTANDFSGDVIYTVTAEDSSTKNYTVWVLTTVSNRTDLDAMIANGDDVSRLDTSLITDMSSLFSGMGTFNQDLSRWDVSSVTNMRHMFFQCSSFNQDLSRWDVSSVYNMGYMFAYCTIFNQDIGDWDVSDVTYMDFMFSVCKAFNQDIGDWDVSKVIDMSYMLNICNVFNQDLSSWADHVAETIDHDDFSTNATNFETTNHPYASWDS